ncbi:unnamed protein product [Bursaphelenchus okinawaensis]|uniref:Cyclin N-terminal domain-containing protein n=1 Tax=Bursaphelenchus okinawaensis TaxID=465554 RepID=A0A811KVD9_9BILA|nr:unnamed protein product [Bursaphelenchus okinawaensis]CAG9111897.1 unnamed protein product [Bursaphelenchus okinawaensis]
MNDFALPTGPIAVANTGIPGPIKPKWFFSEDELSRSPSCLSGISTTEEQRCIQTGCMFIRIIADRLNEMQPEGKISQLCICVSMVHLKRFFVVHSLKYFDARDVGAAVLFLTSKSEECPKRLDYIVRTWYKLRIETEVQQNEVERTAIINKQTYHKLVEYIVWIENIVLQTIGFNFAIDIPHPFVLRAKDVFRKNDSKFAEFVFWLTTDIIHVTNWCIRYKPSVIAGAAFYMAILWSENNNTFPGRSSKGDEWYQYFDPTLTHQQLDDMTHEFIQLWRHIEHRSLNKISKVDHKALAERIRRSSSTNSTPNTNTTTTSSSSPASHSSSRPRV